MVGDSEDKFSKLLPKAKPLRKGGWSFLSICTFSAVYCMDLDTTIKVELTREIETGETASVLRDFLNSSRGRKYEDVIWQEQSLGDGEP